MMALPTATHVVVPVHATPDNKVERAPAGATLASIAQRLPFHRSTSEFVALPMSYRPTAVHSVALVHATADSSGFVAPVGLGAATGSQRSPFHRSTNGFRELLSVYRPTAKQLLVVAHATLASWLKRAPTGAGLAITDHLPPVHRSISAAGVPEPFFNPTAKHVVLDGQLTAYNEPRLTFGLADSAHFVPSQMSTNGAGCVAGV